MPLSMQIMSSLIRMASWSLIAQFFSGMLAEDSTELFETDYFGTPEPGFESIRSLIWSRCYGTWSRSWLWSSIRAENQKLVVTWLSSDDGRYSYLDTRWSHLICSLCQGSSSRCLGPAPRFRKHWAWYGALWKRYIAEPFKRITYDEAIDFARAWKRWRCWLRAFGTWRWLGSHHMKTWI